jgi:hypothetical protein
VDEEVPRHLKTDWLQPFAMRLSEIKKVAGSLPRNPPDYRKVPHITGCESADLNVPGMSARNK